MKKLFFVSLLAASIGLFSSFDLQAQTFKNGDMVGNLGAGFGWYGYGYGATSLPAISVSLEKGIKELDFGTLSIGGIVGFKHASYNNSYYLTYSDKQTWNDIIVAARGAVHVDLLHVDKLDTYGGLALGLRFQTYKYRDYVYPYGANDYKKVSTSTANPLFAIFVGGRYYFTEKLAGFGELGYGLGYLTLGLSLKLN